MTSKVTIEAHCSSSKEVHISVAGGYTGENRVLQDGESTEFYVYDEREVNVREVEKSETTTEFDPAGGGNSASS